jgi:hypothetical protein
MLNGIRVVSQFEIYHAESAGNAENTIDFQTLRALRTLRAKKNF